MCRDRLKHDYNVFDSSCKAEWNNITISGHFRPKPMKVSRMTQATLRLLDKQSKLFKRSDFLNELVDVSDFEREVVHTDSCASLMLVR